MERAPEEAQRHDTEPDMPAFDPADEPLSSEEPPSSGESPSAPPLRGRRPQARGARHQRTLGRSSPPQPKDATAQPMSVHLIVEVGTPGAPNGRKTTKSYRPEHLVTKPGLGVPKGETVSR